MTLFILSTADMFLIMAASSDSSPYANMGASREMIQMMAYEPLTLLVAVGFYLTTGFFPCRKYYSSSCQCSIVDAWTLGWIYVYRSD